MELKNNRQEGGAAVGISLESPDWYQEYPQGSIDRRTFRLRIAALAGAVIGASAGLAWQCTPDLFYRLLVS